MNEPSANLSTVKILIEGRQIPASHHVLAISVNRSYNKISSARVVLADGDAASRDFALSNQDDFKPGTNIEIQAGYHADDKTIFKGLIVEHGIRTRRNQASRLTLHCKDKAMSLNRGGDANVVYRDSLDSEAIEEILRHHGLASDVKATETRHGTLIRFNSSCWDFIVARAEKNGLLVYTDDGKVTLGEPDLEQEPAAALTYGDNIFDFDLNIDSRNQVDTVSGSSWDFSSQQVIVESAAEARHPEPGNLSARELDQLIGSASVNLGHCGFLPDQELRGWANARLQASRLSKIRGWVKIQGDDRIKPGKLISLSGVGDRFNGVHFVAGVQHSITQGDWLTDLQLGLSPHWFTEVNDINPPSAAGLLAAVSGLQIGIVTQLEEDPMAEDRIRIKLPLLDSEDEGVWARIACLDAGENRGAFFRPEIDDEIVVGFLNDDPRHPVVLGMLNSSAKPAPITASDDNHEKGFVTRGELKIIFDDDKKSLSISTPSDKKIQLDEDAGVVTLSDEHGNRIEMNSDGISMTSQGDIKIAADGDIKLQGMNLNGEASSLLSIKGESSAEITSSGNTVVKGALVKIN